MGMASLSSPDRDACNLMKLLWVYARRREGGNWGMGSHFERINLFCLFISAAVFTSTVDGHQYDVTWETFYNSVTQISGGGLYDSTHTYFPTVDNESGTETGTLFAYFVIKKYLVPIPAAQRYPEAVFSPSAAFSIQVGRELQDLSPVVSPPTGATTYKNEAPSSSPSPYENDTPPPLSIHPTPLTEHSPPIFSPDSSTATQGEKKRRTGIIVGPIVAGIAVLALVAVPASWMYKKKQAENGDLEKPGASTPQSPRDHRALLPVKETTVAYSMEALSENEANRTAGEETAFSVKAPEKTTHKMVLVDTLRRRFTYNDILNITRNFSMVISESGSATVYYGQLQEGGLKVAVKRLRESGSQFGILLAEIKILMRIHHRNLVSLIGFCEEQYEIILVSEYMANGSLFELLKARTGELTWKKRLQIALEAATGLEYMHTGCKPSIIHRDIKSANILLNENMEAKLTNFGLSKAGAVDGTEFSSYHTKAIGTMGYIDPEYLYRQKLTKMSDVYSFGVVLFELITGKPAIVVTETNEKLHLTNWVMPKLMRGEMESVLDPLMKEHCNIESVWEVATIARTATQHPSGRPDMAQIVSTLKDALRMETSWVNTNSIFETITSQTSFREIPQNPTAR